MVMNKDLMSSDELLVQLLESFDDETYKLFYEIYRKRLIKEMVDAIVHDRWRYCDATFNRLERFYEMDEYRKSDK